MSRGREFTPWWSPWFSLLQFTLKFSLQWYKWYNRSWKLYQEEALSRQKLLKNTSSWSWHANSELKQQSSSQFIQKYQSSAQFVQKYIWEGLLPVLASPSPYQDCVAIPWFLHAQVQAIAVSQSPFQFQLPSPYQIKSSRTIRC